MGDPTLVGDVGLVGEALVIFLLKEVLLPIELLIEPTLLEVKLLGELILVEADMLFDDDEKLLGELTLLKDFEALDFITLDDDFETVALFTVALFLGWIIFVVILFTVTLC